MAFSRAAKIAGRHLMNVSKHLSAEQAMRPSTFYMSQRLLTYLVGVDGSGYGFAALRNTVAAISSGDEIVCMYFPPNLELMMVTPTTVMTVSKELYDAQHEQTKHIEDKCKEIVQQYTPKDRDIKFEMHVGEHSFSPKDDLVAEAYKIKADVMVVGAKGLSHSIREKLADKITGRSGAGSVTNWVLHNAPCDVMVVKIPHEY
mmetsp:Transcript_37437/g.59958  ORF Transcript_37437/g.59958 Transcript_37437/m.59958 type:complete len:202 (+) Transcript_37437:20-625(+)|eukprot:CAMPEP_0197058060 /NCGR_PEP_ID=MMETSP1384-20130603/103509_1 /TAXON_ID=29189 /ORGANISM="Ammonia sp." /LENGTH=201 /DNA_ID=CAMNT_0042492673 /DNA_START=21 /DNA_END=626 /DNA_ORIENTATION=+